MSILSAIGNAFKSFGKFIGPTLKSAAVKGLTDELVKQAAAWAKVAASQQLDNAGKREFVVNLLVKKGVPESIARLATELGVQAIKAEVKKLP